MKLLAIDGNIILNRAFYGIKLLTTKDGFYTNGIYGFLNILHKLMTQTGADRFAVAFDMRAKTFRHNMYEGYKANRHGMPEELAQQLPKLKELLSALGFCIIECEGYEADDILGTLSKMCDDRGDDCVIATGDRDSLQLISDNTSVLLTTTKASQPSTVMYDRKALFDEYGVEPPQMIDIKALMGDSSDCIPGVSGIGKVTAQKLISEYHDIDNIYDNIDSLDIKPGVRAKLQKDRDMAYLSRRLGTICRTAPIDINDRDLVKRDNSDRAGALMSSLELFSLMDKFGVSPSSPAPSDSSPGQAGNVEFSSVLPDLSAIGGDAYFVFDEDNGKSGGLLLFNNTVYSLNDGEIAVLLSNERVKLVCSDSKKLFKTAALNGISAKCISLDITLAAYLLDPNSSDYDILRLCGAYSVAADNSAGLSDNVKRLAAMPALSRRLMEEIGINSMSGLLYDIEMPLSDVLARMELEGFYVDSAEIVRYKDRLIDRIDALQMQIYTMCGEEFNINSPKQLGEVLFERMGLKGSKKTKTGYSTSADVLEALAGDNPVVTLILEYRTLTKFVSTYCDGLLSCIADDDRIHTTFNQTETRTGRISSTEPNLQNIPIRTDVGREFRKMFRAKDGYLLVDADYSQIELRVLAHISGDNAMRQAFIENKDIHQITASQVFGIPEDFVTPVMRSRAKAVNFGIVYGIGAFSLAKDIGVSFTEASRYIKQYMAHYSGVQEYMKRIVESAKKDGFVRTEFDRRRYLPELKSSNRNLVSFGERVARNMPIQGTAADIIKIAMIRVNGRLRDEGLDARLVLQVHDELIVEAKEDIARRAADILREEMSGCVKLSVPLVVDVGIGQTWFEAH